MVFLNVVLLTALVILLREFLKRRTEAELTTRCCRPKESAIIPRWKEPTADAAAPVN